MAALLAVMRDRAYASMGDAIYETTAPGGDACDEFSYRVGAKMLRNKLGISNEAELAREEERLTKLRALELYDTGLLDSFDVGTFKGLSQIHQHLFQDVYDFAGETRSANIAKGSFRFAPVLYLAAALDAIDRMPHDAFDHIVEKYVEMNVARPFREGSGRSGRIWLDAMLRAGIDRVVDWGAIGREDHLLAMERSPVRDIELPGIPHERI